METDNRIKNKRRDILITVIIPVYNVEQYLAQCLESVLQQDFKKYEILCVNDASTDSSAEILNTYAAKYENIRIITHAHNRGLSGARNTGLVHAQGKYILFVDSDDMIVQGTLQELYEAAEKKQLDIVYFNLSKIFEDDVFQRNAIKKNYEYNGLYTGRELFCQYSNNNDYKVEAWRQFFNRDFLLKNDLRFMDGILHEDTLFSFLCAMKAERVMDINKTYYIYRQRKGSIMYTKNEKRARSMFVVLTEIFTYWNGNGFSEEENLAIAKYFQGLYEGYRYYQSYGHEDSTLEFGSEAERTLYRLLNGSRKNKWLELTEAQIDFIQMNSRVFVYGAGKGANEIIETLKKRNIPIESVVVENTKENPDYFCNIKVMDYKELKNCSDACVIIGVTKKYADGIEDNLRRIGVDNIVIAEDVD